MLIFLNLKKRRKMVLQLINNHGIIIVISSVYSLDWIIHKLWAYYLKTKLRLNKRTSVERNIILKCTLSKIMCLLIIMMLSEYFSKTLKWRQ